jgi:hypothetical protein
MDGGLWMWIVEWTLPNSYVVHFPSGNLPSLLDLRRQWLFPPNLYAGWAHFALCLAYCLNNITGFSAVGRKLSQTKLM